MESSEYIRWQSSRGSRLASFGHPLLLERLRLGPRGRSAPLHSMVVGAFNKQFEPVRTEADWLSRDSAEIDKYVADPLCRFRPTVQLWIDLLSALYEIAIPARQARIPNQLPIYVIAGTRDSPKGSPSLVVLLALLARNHGSDAA